jgi:hypothetical protein
LLRKDHRATVRMHETDKTRRGRALAGAGLFAVAALVVVLARWNRVAPISNDGIQYVEAARQLLAGHGYATSLVFFDEQHAAGVIPAPQTVWPPGYPVAIAAAGKLGMGLETAARLVARGAFVAIIPLVFLIALRLTGNPILASLAAFWQLGVTELWMYLAAPNSELPFLALSLAALVAVPRDGDAKWRWALAGLLAGLSVTVRYAGLFLLATLGMAAMIVAWHRWRHGRRGVLQPLMLLAPGAALAGALLLRNQLLVGNLSGGNSKPVHQPVGYLLRETMAGMADLLTGVVPGDLARSGFRRILAGLGLAVFAMAAIVMLVSGARFLRKPLLEREDHRYGMLLGAYVAIYLAAVISTASRTMLTYGARYLIPVVPVVICLVIFLLSTPRRTPLEQAA